MSFNVTNGVRAMFESLLHCLGIVFGFSVALRSLSAHTRNVPRMYVHLINRGNATGTTAVARRRGRRPYRLLKPPIRCGRRRDPTSRRRYRHLNPPIRCSRCRDAPSKPLYRHLSTTRTVSTSRVVIVWQVSVCLFT